MFANQLCQMAKSTSASQVCQLHLAKLPTPHCQGIIKLKVSIQQFQFAISQDEKLSTSGHVENGYGTGKNQSRTKLMRGLKQVVGKERKL
jgi:hypothetical protein